ncbi:hypothetical protein LARV_03365 [Longilinea arvoryzae]|uniref:Bacterial spore germination immunoglobulin-like domain-containing protein n=1 Tax=Longilinea arvoryzae TaxID=360412 RepID=A0A0S7BM37_9CHLR|nr:hypothetical protein [Longilinea arvoryzae]GAP15574.1 hypothetical protein LARV_03365 [Longilinea arvoryzae]
MKPSSILRKSGWILLITAGLVLVAGCNANRQGAPLLTPPALRTEIAAQTQNAGYLPQATDEISSSTSIPEDPSNPDPAVAETATPQATVPPAEILPPTDGPTPTKTPWRRRTPTITPTPQPPEAVMFIHRPGLFSKVKSPLTINASAMTGADGMVWVELIGEDGRDLFQTRLNFSAYTGRSISIAPEITFELQAPAELARLVISTRDQFNRISALTSTDLILIQMGDDQIFQSGYSRAAYIVRAPLEGQVISGGVLQVTALVRPVNENPLILELVDEQGNVVGSTSLDLVFPTGDLSHTPFDVAIPYTVSQQTDARLVLRQESTGRIPGTVALTSLELTLQP